MCKIVACMQDHLINFFVYLVEGRKKLLEINLRDVKVGDDVVPSGIARKLDGYSGADITSVCR